MASNHGGYKTSLAEIHDKHEKIVGWILIYATVIQNKISKKTSKKHLKKSKKY